MGLNPLTLIDFYKSGHLLQYPKGTSQVFSNLTARASRVDGVREVVFFGLSYYLQEYLVNTWEKEFFSQPKEDAVRKYKRRMTNAGITITL
jgi:nicotinamide phosphoribosyltransferase